MIQVNSSKIMQSLEVKPESFALIGLFPSVQCRFIVRSATALSSFHRHNQLISFHGLDISHSSHMNADPVTLKMIAVAVVFSNEIILFFELKSAENSKFIRHQILKIILSWAIVSFDSSLLWDRFWGIFLFS